MRLAAHRAAFAALALVTVWGAPAAAAAQDRLVLPGGAVSIPNDGNWAAIPDTGAAMHAELGLVVLPLASVDRDPTLPIPGPDSPERQAAAQTIARGLVDAGYRDVRTTVGMRRDGTAILVEGIGPSSLHGGDDAITYVHAVVARPWSGSISLVVPVDVREQARPTIDAVLGGWTVGSGSESAGAGGEGTGNDGDPGETDAWRDGLSRDGQSTDNQPFDGQFFRMVAPSGFTVVARAGPVVTLSGTDGAYLLAVSRRLRALSPRGVLGLRSILNDLAGVDALDVGDVDYRDVDGTARYRLDAAGAVGDHPHAGVHLVLSERDARAAALLLVCPDGACDTERDGLDEALRTFAWR